MCEARNLLNARRMRGLFAECTILLALGAGCGASSASTSPGSDAGMAEDAATGDDAATTGATWSASAATPMSVARWGMPIAYAPSIKAFVGFGGATNAAVADTFAFTPADAKWTSIAATGSPPARYCHCLAFLPEQNQLLLVGGRDDNGPLPAGAWTLDLATSAWSAVSGDVPSGVIGCMATYMEKTKRAVVFGGGSARLSSDTWSYDPIARAFTLLSPKTSPPGRMDGMAVYDPGDGGRMLMFGGEYGIGAPTDDLWSFDGTDWTKLAPNGAKPPKRRVPAHAFDAKRRTWFLFGGTIDTKDLKDVWALDAATLTWTQLPDDTAPKARGFTSTGYDPVSESYFVFGGLLQPSDVAMKDGWAVKLSL